MKIQYEKQGVYVLESALFRTTTTVLFLAKATLVVDPNWLPAEITFIQSLVRTRGNDNTVYLLFTHADYDHIIGYGAFPEAQVIASRQFQDNPSADRQIREIHKFDQTYYIERAYPIVYPSVNFTVEQDEQKLIIANTLLRFWLAPGHTPEGIFSYLPEQKILLMGDYLSNIEFPYVYHSFAAYRDTLAKARAIITNYPIKLFVSGHGDVACTKEEMHERCEAAFWYLNKLEESVQQEQPFPEQELWNRYDFRLGMQTFHANNLALLKKEITK